MKKFILTSILAASTIMSFGQYSDTTEYDEDNSSVVTIADIMDQQERVTSQHSTTSHFEKVWGNKTYLNLSYQTSVTLTPKETITLGFDAINNNEVPEFKADYGAAIQIGHSYSLLKKPIVNIVNFYIDYTFIDLSMAHYKKEPGEYVYNSDNTWDQMSSSNTRESKQYIPWCLEKYDISYGMNLGPSVTAAPFTMLPLQALHFIKFNVYYHIGYQAGLLWMPNNKKADEASKDYGEEPLKLNWQHGLVQSFGFNVSWKAIGFGFETRSDSRTYKAVNTSDFGKEKYKFKGKSSRIYLRFCY